MPSGKTHDAVTFLLTIPASCAAWLVTGEFAAATLITVSFLFGGLMFGPDLDIQSTQHTRWSVFSFLWIPYRVMFKHRSRWTHGLVFGTAIRVVYFFGVLTVFAFVITYLILFSTRGHAPGFLEFTKVWQGIGANVRNVFGDAVFPLAFAGVWLGAASHTISDLAVSYIKTGRVGGFL